jgi:hypothetical protein
MSRRSALSARVMTDQASSNELFGIIVAKVYCRLLIYDLKIVASIN